ncbi:MAG: tetratricopeptide (TPR) repeat protein, partial [Verrucomicrobiales bacterium]
MKMISKCLFVTVLSGVWIGSGCQMLRKQSATDASTFPRAHTTSSDSGAGSQEDHPSAKGTEPRSRVSLKDVNYGVDGRPEDLDREAQLTPVNLEFAKALAHYSQGMLHAQHREAGLAATNFLQSLEHNLTDPATYLKASEKIYDQAKELIRDDERDRALYILQRLTELLPERADPHIWKAVIHQAYKQNDRAESEYAAAIKQRPGTIGPYLELARIQFSSRQTDAAILTLKEGTKHAREP